jgi:hypothetical protein
VLQIGATGINHQTNQPLASSKPVHGFTTNWAIVPCLKFLPPVQHGSCSNCPGGNGTVSAETWCGNRQIFGKVEAFVQMIYFSIFIVAKWHGRAGETPASHSGGYGLMSLPVTLPEDFLGVS